MTHITCDICGEDVEIDGKSGRCKCGAKYTVEMQKPPEKNTAIPFMFKSAAWLVGLLVVLACLSAVCRLGG